VRQGRLSACRDAAVEHARLLVKIGSPDDVGLGARRPLRGPCEGPRLDGERGGRRRDPAARRPPAAQGKSGFLCGPCRLMYQDRLGARVVSLSVCSLDAGLDGKRAVAAELPSSQTRC
jgi:hypothetical protein